MKAWRRKGAAALFLFSVSISITWMGHIYFQYISRRVYEEGTSHLVEIYSQVNHNFTSFLEKNWRNLEDWSHQIPAMEDAQVLAFLEERRQNWNFSQFYFMAPDGLCLAPGGGTEQFLLEYSRDALFQKKEHVMSVETLGSRQAVTLFAIPVPGGSYGGFDYSAIAVSYTNADIVDSLDADAFSGQSMCLVLYADGKVLLSTQSGGSIFGNYLSYLSAGSNLDSKALAKIRQDWEDGVSGVIRCEIGGVNHYVSYLPVGYEGCILLGVVPEEAATASLLQIQRVTIAVLALVFFPLGMILSGWVVRSYRQKAKANALELRYRDLMFDVLSNNVDDLFLMVDSKSWRADYVSPNVERLLGIPLDAVIKNVRLLGESVAKEYDPISQEELDSIPVRGSRRWEMEHVHQGSGERRWYRTSAYRENVQGVEKFVVVMSDRTLERNMSRNLETALAAAKNANEAKSHFLSNMSHDIRTPMNAIVGFSVLLDKEADNADKVREYTRKISASSQHLLSLINDVLDMSKIESGKTSLNIASFGLPGLLEELHTILLPQAKAKGQTFEFHTKGRPAEQLLGDRLRLNQILINLLANAIKYTQEGGNIHFTVEELPRTSPHLANLRFVVADNGMGMSEEFVKSVFDPFSRELNSTISGIQGTGLGMAITRNLVELMGGIIHVSSRQGMGSTFTVELSFALPTQSGSGQPWIRRDVSRVLVADDEEDICLDIQAIMKEAGVEVSYVTQGAAAVETALLAQERGEDFHVILLDWKIPGQSGVETARQIRQKLRRDIPILVLTSYDWSDIEDEALAAGIDAFIPKPFFLSTFQQTLETLYASRRGQELAGGEQDLLAGKLFLVAEDNELNAEILLEMLDMEGARCELAANGQEAADMFLRSQPGYYDMILMDVQMPVMNGYDATRQIRSCAHPRAKTIPIVAMTANAFAEDVRNALDSGMNGHLSKPLDMNAVKTLLGRLLRSASDQAGAQAREDAESQAGSQNREDAGSQDDAQNREDAESQDDAQAEKDALKGKKEV